MYIIKAIHAKFHVTFELDLDKASAADLANVKDPGSLPAQDKRRYFDRKAELEKAARLAIVKQHVLRMKQVLADVKSRAIGPEDDAVHQKLREVTAKLNSVLQIWKHKAETGARDFSELRLVNDLRAPLQELKSHLADSDDGADHKAGLERARKEVGDALARGEAGVRASVQGAAITYRGSLATGWRNALKSEDGMAQRINLLKFDSDAFVEIPSATWEGWADLEIVTEREREGKMDLSELITRAQFSVKPHEKEMLLRQDYIKINQKYGQGLKSGNVDQIHLDRARAAFEPRKRALDQLVGIQKVEEQLRLAMETVKGYKKNSKGEADFSFVLQSSKKTAREVRSGNLYPLNEVAKGGLPLTEADLEIVYESGVIKVRMPERHISMSKQVAGTTYDWETPQTPHTQSRPTEAMLISQYLALDPNLAAFRQRGTESWLQRLKEDNQS